MIDNNILDIVKDILKNLELNYIIRVEEKDLWHEKLNEVSYVPIDYTNHSIDYQTAYFIDKNDIYLDLSLILLNDKKVIALWPLALSCNNSNFSITSFSDSILPPLFIKNCNVRTQKNINKRCIDFIITLANKFKIASFHSHIPFNNINQISNWQLQLMKLGAKSNFLHELYVDLNIDLNEIKANFRTSYKSLINSGQKLWNVNILNQYNIDVWKQFKELHLEVSKRKTRNDESWNIQHQAISENNAILIYLQDLNLKMVGGALFDFSRDEVMYSVGVYDRNLFDKPLGHVVQFAAIQEFKKRNLKKYKLGVRHYINDFNNPNEKELKISEFKEGFATYSVPKFCLIYDLN